jgi:hypothetical protein
MELQKGKNMTIVEMTQNMLKTKSLGNEFWVEAMHTTIYTLNICPMREILNLTPED